MSPSRIQDRCPVCAGASRPLLALPAQPIYQHPVPVDVIVPPPHATDLYWVACNDCAHAWQPQFDNALLEQIYRSHYYTPAPDGIAVQFRNEFLAAAETFGLITPRRVLLEIGASDGEVLAELKVRTGATVAYAFEPNSENASVARRRGLDVRERFFGKQVSEEGLDLADLIYARHVIEHIFDFNDFFVGLDAIATSTADLILETPSLDFHAQAGSVAPFHIEHIHVFALRSLARLAANYGWGLRNSEVTAPGNLVAFFRKGPVIADAPPPSLEGLQESVSQRKIYLRKLLVGHPLVFWGAGSAGVGLANTIGREPDIWTDGNPNKVGKRFVGLNGRIVSPEAAFAEAASAAYSESILVIASSFFKEILPCVRQLGWKGEVLDPEGNCL